jgi:uncharacterized membrane protein YkvA (DUF1232 family)
MNTAMMTKMINDAVEVENSTSNLKNVLNTLAQNGTAGFTLQQVPSIQAFISGYITSVPQILIKIEAAMQETGQYQKISSIITEIQNYFSNPLDVMPDHLGLLGLMDDAYVALCLVEKVANAYLTAKGKKELPNDLSEANRIMRILIGEPHCSILDSTINSIFQGPQFQNAFNALLSMAAFNSRPFSNPPHPIWGNASVDEIVKVQMGAMGIF